MTTFKEVIKDLLCASLFTFLGAGVVAFLWLCLKLFNGH